MYKYGLIACLMLAACSGANTTTFPQVQYDAGYVGCSNDQDCQTNGGGCGTDVCSWKNATVHVCVPASSGDFGWCGDDPYLLANGQSLPQAEADHTCKCFNEGATCNIDTNYCSFTHQ
jgi:hypothetical protein